MKYYLETYGCQANKSDSDIMNHLLSKKFKKAKEKSADIIIINTCYVKQTTQNRIINRLKQLSKSKKQIIITGCMPEIDSKKIKQILPKSILVSSRNIPNILKAIKTKKDFLGKPKINKAKSQKKPLTEIYTIQISEGCTNACSYCVTKQARGNLYSFPISSIISETKQAIKKGYKKIYLTSQDTAAYGLDKNKTSQIPTLLNHLTKIPGDFQIRVGMMHPSNLLPILKPLTNSLKSKKIIKFIHLPIQSGSDKILKSMNRNYNITQIKKIFHHIRKEIPNLHISTDIIVGYPTETREDFKKTLNIIKILKPNHLNLSRYSKRPKTSASKLKQLPTQELKARSKELSELFKKISSEHFSSKN